MKKEVNEIFFLRAIACLAVVFLHSISSFFRNSDLSSGDYVTFLRSIQLLLMFGTPTFVLISEFLVSHSYPNGLPPDFYKKRITYILYPYLFMGLFYGWFSLWNASRPVNADTVLTETGRNIFFGEFHGYFVLIIFQFYLLHSFFHKFIDKRFSPKRVIITAFIINFLYLAIFNAIRLPKDAPVVLETIWRYSKLPFLGWLFYFTVAFYCGKNLLLIQEKVKKYGKVALLLVFVFALGLLFDYHILGLRSVNSKRVDMIPYTIVVSGLLFYGATKMKNIPSFFITISQYSYGIYLLHMFLLALFERLIPKSFSDNYSIVYIVSAFVFCLFCSIAIVHILNKFKYGPYLVGKLGRGSSKKALKEADVIPIAAEKIIVTEPVESLNPVSRANI